MTGEKAESAIQGVAASGSWHRCVGLWWTESDGVHELLSFLDLVQLPPTLQLISKMGAADTAGWGGEWSCLL